MIAAIVLSALLTADGDAVKAKAADAKSAASPAPLVVKAIAPVAESDRAGAVARGVDFLIRTQNKTGSWGAPTKTKELNIMADIGSHTAFRIGTTSLVLMALSEVEKDRPETTAAIKKGEEWLVKALPELRRGTPIELYNVWGHAYAIQALVLLKKRPEATADRKATFDRLIKEQL